MTSPALQIFQEQVITDEEYRQRLALHYRIFKAVVANPFHPAHRRLGA